MAADTAETVLTDIRLGGMKGKDTTPEQIEEIRSTIRNQYEEQSDPYYATSRVWDDGIISPLDTRDALGMCLSLVARQDAPVSGDRIVYRM